MAAPKGSYRKGPLDYVAEALLHLEGAEAALAHIDDGRVSSATRAAIEEIRAAVQAGKLASGQGIDLLLGTTPPQRTELPVADQAPAPPTAARQRRTG